jgi:hypothetical protein
MHATYMFWTMFFFPSDRPVVRIQLKVYWKFSANAELCGISSNFRDHIAGVGNNIVTYLLRGFIGSASYSVMSLTCFSWTFLMVYLKQS